MRNLGQRLRRPGSVNIHWVDNFARTFARQGLYLNREQFASMLWTAHGIKKWPGEPPVNLKYLYANGDCVRAMPPLSFILSDEILAATCNELILMSIHHQQESLSEQRHVRRVPLKPSALTPDEAHHMSQSLDGLRCFEPVDIYNTNIQAYDGLLAAIQKCQKLEGFGATDNRKDDEYSMLLMDVSTFWMTFRLLYSFTGLVPILQDLFLILGPWHNYMYSHTLVWSEFRSSFLADAYFTLFPKENLFFRPKLLVSSTFFTWLRAAYPSIRLKLLYTLNLLKFLASMYDIEFTRKLKRGKFLKTNPYRSRFLKLHSLFYLFEFVLPVIADYGSALKLNNWDVFWNAYVRLFRVFLCSTSKGILLLMIIFS